MSDKIPSFRAPENLQEAMSDMQPLFRGMVAEMQEQFKNTDPKSLDQPLINDSQIDSLNPNQNPNDPVVQARLREIEDIWTLFEEIIINNTLLNDTRLPLSQGSFSDPDKPENKIFIKALFQTAYEIHCWQMELAEKGEIFGPKSEREKNWAEWIRYIDLENFTEMFAGNVQTVVNSIAIWVGGLSELNFIEKIELLKKMNSAKQKISPHSNIEYTTVEIISLTTAGVIVSFTENFGVIIGVDPQTGLMTPTAINLWLSKMRTGFEPAINTQLGGCPAARMRDSGRSIELYESIERKHYSDLPHTSAVAMYTQIYIDRLVYNVERIVNQMV